MQARNQTYTGHFTQDYFSPPGQFWFRAQDTFNPRARDVLFGIESHEGDFVHANVFKFQKVQEEYWTGRGSSRVAGSFEVVDDGPRGFGTAGIDLSRDRDLLYNQCLSKMFDKVRGGIDLAVEAAQAGQTVGMMRGVAGVVGFARDVRTSVTRGRPVGAVADFLRKHDRRFDRTKTAGELWLEYQYGWKPLVQTVYDCANQLVEPSLTDRWSLLVLRTRSKEKQTLDRTRTSNVRVTTDQAFWPETLTGVYSQRGEMLVQWRIPPSRVLDLSRWTSFNPSGIVWELLPYSFVVDWFIDVGGWLRNLESACLFNSAFVRGYFTYTRLVNYSSVIDGVSPAFSDGYPNYGKWKCSLRYAELERSVLSNVFPKTPGFDPKLGWQRLVSAAGLLSGFLGRR